MIIDLMFKSSCQLNILLDTKIIMISMNNDLTKKEEIKGESTILYDFISRSAFGLDLNI